MNPFSRRKQLLLSALLAVSSSLGTLIAETNSSSNTLTASQNSEDQFRLGRAYYHGEGVTQSYEQAGFWYRKAADQGNTKAMHNLGIMFLEGQGTKKDEAEGYHWIRKAAEANDPKAIYLYGVLLCEGRGASKNPKEGVEWIRKAAVNGNSAAIARLGQDYLFGDDEQPKDLGKAFDLIHQAAQFGNPWACGALGQLYFKGEGVALNKKEAAHWLEIGARAGDSAAMAYYGHLLMEESPQKAYPWFKLALLRNAPTGLMGMAFMECKQALTPAEIVEGDKEAVLLNQQVPTQQERLQK